MQILRILRKHIGLNIFNPIKSIIKKKFNFLNTLFSSLLAYASCFLIYPFLVSHIKYFNLNDFYYSETILQNHNKFCDIWIFFIYLLLFYIFFTLLNFKNIKKFDYDLSKVNKVISVIIIVATAFVAVRYLLNYDIKPVLDTFHYGEKFGAYYLHAKLGMKYFSDIMLMHGYIDVLPAQIADKILGELDFINERIAHDLVGFIFLISSIIISAILFKRQYVSIIMLSGLFAYLLNLTSNPYTNYAYLNFLFVVYILLIEKYKNLNNYVWNTIFLILFIFGIVYHSTYSFVFAVSMVPLLIKRIIDYKKFCMIFYSIAAVIILLLFSDYLIPYFKAMTFYAKNSVIVFGKSFPHITNLFEFTFGCSCLLISPVLINLLLKTKTLKVKYIILLGIIMPILLLPYAFGRIDHPCLVRYRPMSIFLLSAIIPYIMMKLKSKYFYIYNLLILIVISFLPANVYYPVECCNYDKEALFIQKQVPRDKLYLDLTMNSMMYYYADRKAAMPFSACSIVNSKQQDSIIKKFEKEKPFLAGLGDSTSISAWTYKLYKYFFLSDSYSVINHDGNIYLKYNNNKSQNNIAAKKNLDYIFQEDILDYLPEAWGSSIKTLPMKEVNKNIKIDNLNISVNNGKPFNKVNLFYIEDGIQSKDANLLYLKYESEGETSFLMTINNIDSPLQFKSNKKQVLIPIDYYPSWLLADKIYDIQLFSDKNIKIKEAKLYLRN